MKIFQNGKFQWYFKNFFFQKFTNSFFFVENLPYFAYAAHNFDKKKKNLALENEPF